MHIAADLGFARNILGLGRGKALPLIVLLSLSTTCGILPGPAFAQTYSFSSVRIEGNERVDAPTILGFARIGQGEAISAGQLNDAVQRITNSGLFESVDVVPSGNTLVIRVKEYPTINIINFEGNRRIKDEALSAIITSRSRRVFSPAQAESDAALIAEGYQQQGRIAATVEPKIIRRDGNRVDLVFEIREGRVVEIERLSFNGNRAYSDRRLRQVLETKQAGILRRFFQSDTFNPDRIEVDKQLLRDFYLARGFVDVQVQDAVGEVTRERDGYFVTFTVQEGQRFQFGQISATSEVEGVDAEEFRRLIKIRPGVTYSPTVVETNITRMENLALRKGLNFVQVEPRVTRNERTQTLDVEFAITRGPRVFVERIDIEGNTTTLDEVVRREFRSSEGDPFNPREIRRSAERIRALGYFSEANVEAEQGSAADQVVVNVDVVEQPTGSLTFGVTYGADSGAGIAIAFQETNFLGRGQTLGVNVVTGTDNAAGRVNFLEPHIFGRDLAFGIDVGYAETDNQNSFYGTRVANVGLSLGFPISENGRLTLNYKANDSRVKNVVTDSSQVLKDEAARGGELISSIGYQFQYDTRTTGLNPNGGVLLRFSQDFAGLGGDISYVSTNALALAERRIFNDDVTLRAVFEGGVIATSKGVTRVTDRFFGNNAVRGFEANGFGPRDLVAPNNDALGGNAYAAVRFEAEFPLGLPSEYGLKGAAFADFGSVWGLDNTNGGAAGGSPVDDAFHLRSSVGVSLLWDSPLGPLRVNFARAIKKQTYDRTRVFDLTISTQF